MIKKTKNYIVLLFVLLSYNTFSQPIPPGYPNGHGQTNNQPGGGAPIDGSLSILLLMGVAYGAKKTYNLMKDTQTKVN